jgi:Flp pilus assembly protein TadD
LKPEQNNGFPVKDSFFVSDPFHMENHLPGKKIFFALAGICFLTSLLYSGMLKYPVLSNDDAVFFTKYPEILNLSWNSLGQYFSSYHVSLYQPLTVLTFAINYHFSGTSPLPLHLVNLLFHLVNILLVFVLFKSLLKEAVPALLVAFLFAVHPMNVEAVTWISARSSTMYTCFYLLSLIFYLKYHDGRPKPHLLLLALLFFLFSLFCKVQAVTLPLVLLLFDYFSGRRNIRQLLFEKVPFVILSIVFIIVAFRNPETSTFYAHSKLQAYTASDLIFLNGRAIFFYLQKFLLPVNLSAVYVFPAKTGSWLPAEYYMYTFFVLLLCVVLYKYRKNREVIFGAGIFLFTLSVNLPLISVRSVIFADRYAYFPFLGLLFILASRFQHFRELPVPVKGKTFYGLLLALAVFGFFFSLETWEANKKWENDMTLATNIIDKNPPVRFIAKIYRKRGNYLEKQQKAEESVADYSKALELDPEDIYARIARARVLIKLNRPGEALPDLDKAIERLPETGALYSERAMLRLNTGDKTGAWQDCSKCLSLDSANAEAYNFRAVILFESGDLRQAEKELRSAIRYNNRYAEAYKNLGTVFFQMQDQIQACRYWEIAARLGNRQAARLVRSKCQMGYSGNGPVSK